VAKCTRCGKPAYLMYTLCEHCISLSEEERGQPPSPDEGPTSPATPGTTAPRPARSRYAALAAVAGLLRVVALLGMASALIAAGVLLSDRAPIIDIAYLLGVALGCLGLWASAEVVPVIIDIETNTRARAEQNPVAFGATVPGA